MSNKTYAEKLKDPRWQKKRLEILSRDDWSCQNCGDESSTLHVHHKWYETGKEPWEYPNEALVTLCEICHESEELSKPAQKGLINTFLAAGFLNGDIDFMAMFLTKIFEHFSKEKFTLIMSSAASSEQFRCDLERIYEEELSRRIQVHKHLPDNPF